MTEFFAVNITESGIGTRVMNRDLLGRRGEITEVSDLVGLIMSFFGRHFGGVYLGRSSHILVA